MMTPEDIAASHRAFDKLAQKWETVDIASGRIQPDDPDGLGHLMPDDPLVPSPT